MWEPILEPCLSFCKYLEEPLFHSLGKMQDVNNALDQYSDLINATKQGNSSIYKKISSMVSIEDE